MVFVIILNSNSIITGNINSQYNNESVIGLLTDIQAQIIKIKEKVENEGINRTNRYR